MGKIVEFPRKFGQDGDRWSPWLTKRQVATLLQRTPRWVELMVRDHGMPSEMRGAQRFFPHDEVLKWWEERKAS